MLDPLKHVTMGYAIAAAIDPAHAAGLILCLLLLNGYCIFSK